MQLSSNFCNLFKLIATSHAKLLPETNSFQVISFLARDAQRGTSLRARGHGTTPSLKAEGHARMRWQDEKVPVSRLLAEDPDGKQVWGVCTHLFAVFRPQKHPVHPCPHLGGRLSSPCPMPGCYLGLPNIFHAKIPYPFLITAPAFSWHFQK